MSESEFYTIRGYHLHDSREMSDSMEDYLEMIYRHTRQEKFIRVNQLAGLLNVKPPSASKMAVKLRSCGMIDFEPYGLIQLTQRGEEEGAYLLHRHTVLHRLFCEINHSENELALVEQIEHHFGRDTILNIEKYLDGRDRSK